MPGYEGLIKYPLYTDTYGGTYSEPQWWRDLAVTTRAEIAAQVAYRTSTSGSFDANNAADGTDLVHAAVTQTGTPSPGETWWITTATVAGTSRMQEAVSYGDAPSVMRRFRGSAGWSGWERTDAGAVDLTSLGGGGSGGSSVSLKTVPLALTVGGSAATTDTTGSVRFPVRFAARITRWRVHITNVNPRFGTIGTTRNITGVWFGPPTSGGNTSSLTRVGLTQVGTNDYTTAWTTSPLEKNTDYLVGFGYSGSGPVESNVGGGWVSTVSTDAASTTGTWTRATSVPFDVWIEAETDATTPVIAAFGDSLSSGVAATTPVYDSWLSQWCRTNGALPVHYTASGDTMAGWGESNHYKWQRWQNLSRPDAVVHAMGSNDVFGSADLATLQARRAVSMEQLRTLVSPNIVSATIMPRTSATGATEDVRRAYNAWLKGSPDAARDLFDFVPAISSDDENITPGFDADGIHLNTAGYAAVAGTITRPLVSTVVKDVVTDLAYDSGWRNVSSLLPAGVTGNVFLSREGKTVHLMVHNLSTTTAGHTTFLTLPQGFRPTAVSGANWRNGSLTTDNGDTVRPLSYFVDNMRVLNMVTGKQFGGYATWRVPPALPTTLPGVPA